MSYKKFTGDDVFVSRVKTYPKYKFFIKEGNVYINNMPHISGSGHGDIESNFLNVEQGHISLRELNIGEARHPDSFIYQQITHGGYRSVFKEDVINLLGKPPSGSITIFGTEQSRPRLLPLSASIYRTYLLPTTFESNFIDKINGHKVVTKNPAGAELNMAASALKNLAHHYAVHNPDLYKFDNFLQKPINSIRIPSVFYGSSIRKGSVDLKFFYTGSLASRCTDKKQNGELIADSPSLLSGATVGHIFYNEGIIIFPMVTSSLGIGGPTFARLNPFLMRTTGSRQDNPRWLHFGLGAERGNLPADRTPHPSPMVSFEINFEGTSYINQLTMLCHADKGEMNYSNNPTYQDLTQPKIQSFNGSSFGYEEPVIKIKNVASSSFYKGEDDFRKVTYITKVGIYDELDQLIMTVDLSRPYKKEEMDDLTFKIKYDLL